MGAIGVRVWRVWRYVKEAQSGSVVPRRQVWLGALLYFALLVAFLSILMLVVTRTLSINLLLNAVVFAASFTTLKFTLGRRSKAARARYRR